MKKKSENPNPSEFSISHYGSSSGRHHHSVTKHSRHDKLTSKRIVVVDNTNNNQEELEIPAGHYSKKEMQRLTAAAQDKLIFSLFAKRKKK